jgi:hypothetical protein
MTVARSDEDVILPFPTPRRPARHMRSTIVIGSIDAIRDANRFDTYAAALARETREPLLHAVAGTWIPLPTVLAHYAACDTCGFGPERAYANGRATYHRAGSSIYGTLTKMARGVGVTPWAFLGQLQRFWDRGYDGGSLRVVRVGPKEARVDVFDNPLTASPYYRGALRGMMMGAVELFCAKGFARELPGRPPDAVTFRVQWA